MNPNNKISIKASLFCFMVKPKNQCKLSNLIRKLILMLGNLIWTIFQRDI
jgi:hypothetical protein